MSDPYSRQADAAFAGNIPPGFAVGSGYFGGPLAYHVWPRADWDRFPGWREPIWVAGYDGAAEGQEAVTALQALGVPPGCRIAVDMETRRDDRYLRRFDTQTAQMREALEFHDGFSMVATAGYLIEVYGSLSTVFSNPPLNGYWVADYTTDMHSIDQLLQHPSVRCVQYAADLPPGYDASLRKPWTDGELWHG